MADFVMTEDGKGIRLSGMTFFEKIGEKQIKLRVDSETYTIHTDNELSNDQVLRLINMVLVEDDRIVNWKEIEAKFMSHKNGENTSTS